jgi:hypothetical protein
MRGCRARRGWCPVGGSADHRAVVTVGRQPGVEYRPPPHLPAGDGTLAARTPAEGQLAA